MSSGEDRGHVTPAPARRVIHEAGRAGRRRCLVVVSHSERGLSHTLLAHLRLGIPQVEFTLKDIGPLNSIWICGYEESTHAVLEELRGRHPHARILVTRRGPYDGWERGVLAAGADQALRWPLPTDELAAILEGRPRAGNSALR